MTRRSRGPEDATTPSKRRAEATPAPASRADPADDDVRTPEPQASPASGAERAAWIAVAAFAALYPIGYAVIALLRMGHPFELEWMESGVVDHVRRILAGLPLYVEPSLTFTPFIYPPLYFYAAAWVARLLGDGFLPLRLLSFVASWAIVGFVFATVRRSTPRLVPAVLAACLFAASFREGGAWLDLARVDSLSLAFVAAGIFALRLSSPWVGGVLAGVAFALGALTKQSALFVAAPIAMFLLVAEWRRGVAFAGVLAAIAGGATWALDRASGGWYSFYVFDLPRDHPVIGQLLRGFWTTDLLGAFTLALALGAFRFVRTTRATWRRDGMDVAVLAGLLLTAYATKIRVGSYDNLVMPAHLAASLALGWGLGALLEYRDGLGVRGRPLARLAIVLCLVQFTLLLYKPWRQVPTAAHRAAGQQLVASLARVRGEVWIPSHPGLAAMAGKRAWAHELALTDVLRPGDTPQHRKLMEELRGAIRERRFALVVLDHTGWLREELLPHYDHVAQMFGKDEAELFWPLTGFHTRPDYVWVPRGDSTAFGRP